MDIQFPQILFQLINFGLVVFVMAKFLYKPILKILEERAEKVEAGLKAADENLKSQKELTQKEEAVLAKARAEAKKILVDAKKQAQVEADQILTRSKEDAKKVLDSERKNLMAAIDAERKSFNQNLVGLVTAATAKILGTGLSEKEQQAIIEKELKNLEALKLN